MSNKGKDYSSTFRSLAQILTVLRKYASADSPLSVSDICSHLKDGPSRNTIDRRLQDGVPPELEASIGTLHCVTRSCKWDGTVTFVPYDEAVTEDETNNRTRLYYLESPLTKAEWKVFADLILVYPFISQEKAAKYLRVLQQLQPDSVTCPIDRYAYRRRSSDQFPIIDRLDQAIREHRRVRLDYGELKVSLGTDEQGRTAYAPVLVSRKRKNPKIISPYALVWSNGNYYLVVKEKYDPYNLRVDRILDVTLLDQTFEPDPTFDPVEYRDTCPIMYAGTPVFISMQCREELISVLIDLFGTKPRYSAPKDGWVSVTMKVAPDGVRLFALQYPRQVRVLEPPRLVEEIRTSLEAGLQNYLSDPPASAAEQR